MSCPIENKQTFIELMEKNRHLCQTEKCDNHTEQIMLFKEGSFHTHPHGIPYPSKTDLETARKINRPMMCIGLVPQRKTVCFIVNEKSYRKACEF